MDAGAPEVVATGLARPEGPVVLPDGRVAFGEMGRGRISVFDGAAVRPLAVTHGGPNGLTLGSDGALYAAQNGGVEGHWRSDDPTVPGVQRVTLDGTVTTIATRIGGVPTLAPNDLCFGPDGRLWLTDPAHPFDLSDRREGGRVFALDAGGGQLVESLPPVYPNGIGFDVEDRLLWAESYERTLCARGPDGPVVRCRLPDDHLPDGFAVARDGRIFIATVTSHGITVVTPDDRVDTVIPLDDGAKPTNCCFDGSVLWITDFGPGHPRARLAGRLWRVPTDATGLPLHQGAVGATLPGVP